MNTKGTLLLIDNDSTFRFMLADYFSKRGYAVEAFASTTEAYEKLNDENFRPTVILLDIQASGGMSGVEFTSRAKTIRPQTPVVLIAGYGNMDQAIAAIRAGAFNYVLKPFKVEDVELFVDLALQNSRIPEPSNGNNTIISDYPSLGELEKRYMKIVLEKTKGRKERAAKILGINRRTLYRKEREFGWVTSDENEDGAHPVQSSPPSISH